MKLLSKNKGIMSTLDFALKEVYDELFELDFLNNYCRNIFHRVDCYIIPKGQQVLKEAIIELGDNLILNSEKEEFYDFLDYAKIKSRLKNKNSISKDFHFLRVDQNYYATTLNIFHVRDEIYLLFFRPNNKEVAVEKKNNQSIVKRMVYGAFDELPRPYMVLQIVVDEKKEPKEYILKYINKAMRKIAHLEGQQVIDKSIITVYNPEEQTLNAVYEAFISKQPMSLSVYSNKMKKYISIVCYSLGDTSVGLLIENAVDQLDEEQKEALANDPGSEIISEDVERYYEYSINEDVLSSWNDNESRRGFHEYVDFVKTMRTISVFHKSTVTTFKQILLNIQTDVLSGEKEIKLDLDGKGYQHYYLEYSVILNNNKNPIKIVGKIRSFLPLWKNIMRKEEINNVSSLLIDNDLVGLMQLKCSGNFQILFGSPYFYRQVEFNKDELEVLYHNNYIELLDTEEKAKFVSRIKNAIDCSDELINVTLKIKGHYGRTKTFALSGRFSDDKETICFVQLDISFQLEQKEYWNQTQNTYQLFLENSNVLIWEYNIQEDRAQQKGAVAHFYFEEEFIFKPLTQLKTHELLDIDNYNKFLDYFNRVLSMNEGQQRLEFEAYLKIKDNQNIWAKITFQKISDYLSQQMILISFQDITGITIKEKEQNDDKNYIAFIETDISNNFLINYSLKLPENKRFTAYQELIDFLCQSYVDKEYQNKLTQFVGEQSLLQAYLNSQRELQMEFPLRILDRLIWCRADIYLYYNLTLGVICARIFVINFEGERKYELAYLGKASLDALTGFYEFSTVKKLLEFYLKNNIKVALAIVRIDNYQLLEKELSKSKRIIFLKDFCRMIESQFKDKATIGYETPATFMILSKNISHKGEFERDISILVDNLLEKDYQIPTKIRCSAGVASSFGKNYSSDKIIENCQQSLDYAYNDPEHSLIVYQNPTFIKSSTQFTFEKGKRYAFYEMIPYIFYLNLANPHRINIMIENVVEYFKFEAALYIDFNHQSPIEIFFESDDIVLNYELIDQYIERLKEPIKQYGYLIVEDEAINHAVKIKDSQASVFFAPIKVNNRFESLVAFVKRKDVWNDDETRSIETIATIFSFVLKKREKDLMHEKYTENLFSFIEDLASAKAKANSTLLFPSFLSSFLEESVLIMESKEALPFYYVDQKLIERLGFTEFKELSVFFDGKFLNAVHPEDSQKFCVEKIQGNHQTTYRLKSKDGTYIEVNQQGIVVKRNSKPYIVALVKEANLLHKYRIEAEKTKDQLESVLKNKRFGIVITEDDSGWSIIRCNKIFEKFVGVTSGILETKYQNSLKAFLREDESLNSSNYNEKSTDLEECQFEYQINQNNQILKIKHMASKIRAESGKTLIVHVLESLDEHKPFARDITRLQDGFKLLGEKRNIIIWEYDINEHRIHYFLPSESVYVEFKEENVPYSMVSSGYICPESINDYMEMYEKVFKGEKEVSATIKYSTIEEKERWLHISYFTFLDQNNKPYKAIGISEDVTETKVNEIRIKQREEVVQGLIDHNEVYFKINLSTNKVEYIYIQNNDISINQKATFQDVKVLLENRFINTDEKKKFRSIFSYDKLLLAFGPSGYKNKFEFRGTDLEGIINWYEFSLTLRKNILNRDIICYGVVNNINDKKRAELALDKKVEVHPETNCYLKETFLSLASRYLSMQTENDDPVSVLLLDIDNFSIINRSLGHLKAQKTAIEFGKLLYSTFSEKGLVGQFNSDEYIIFYKTPLSESELLEIANKLCQEVRKPNFFLSAPHVSISIGALINKEKDKSIDNLLYKVSIALKTAKQNGKNQVYLYNSKENKSFEKFDAQMFYTKMWERIQKKKTYRETIDGIIELIVQVYQPLHFIFHNLEESNKTVTWSSFGNQKLILEDVSKEIIENLDKIKGEEKDIFLDQEDKIKKILGYYQTSFSKLEIKNMFVYPMYLDAKIVACLTVFNLSNRELMGLRHIGDYLSKLVYRQRYYSLKERYHHYDEITGLPNLKSCREYVYALNKEELSSYGVFIFELNEHETMTKTILDRIKELSEKHFVGQKLFQLNKNRFIIPCVNLLFADFEAKIKQFKEEMNPDGTLQIHYGSSWRDIDIAFDLTLQEAERILNIFKGPSNDGSDILSQASLEELQQAIKNEEFVVLLQPVFEVSSDRIIGAEALVRKKEQGILLTPDRFIYRYEEAKIIPLMDYCIFEKVCGIIVQWQKEGLRPIKVSVNCSRITILEENFIDKMNAIVDKYQIDKNLLVIEITESFGNIDRARIVEFSEKIKNNGYSLSLDDFGSEYSNLSVLSAGSFDYIKLDKAIIKNVFSNEKTMLIVRHMIELAKELGIGTVAEGIETKEEFNALVNLGCDLIQGYYINKPLKLGVFKAAFLKSEKKEVVK